MMWEGFRLGAITELPSRRRYDAAELTRAIDAAADRLRRVNFGPGQLLFLYQKNSAAFFVNLLAAWRVGGCVVPVDPDLPPPRREALEDAFQPHLVIDKEWRTTGSSAVVVHHLGLLTSGSTGLPKMIWHSLEGLETKIKVLQSVVPADVFARTLCFLPTFFGHGLVCNALFPLASGGEIFLSDSFNIGLAAKLDDVIRENDITFLSSTPVVWSLLAQFAQTNDKPTLKRVHCASASLESQQIQFMKKWAPAAEFWNVYGLTEFLGWLGGGQIKGEADAGHVGFPWGAEWQLDPATSEVSIRAPYASPEITDWYATGDLGHLAPDGALVLEGRRDFLINKGGLKIQPEEVERVASGFAGLKSACCFALPDELAGSKVGLAIVLEAATPDETDLIDKLRAWLAARLPTYKVPDRFFVVTSLAVTNRGKLDRRAIRDQTLLSFKK